MRSCYNCVHSDLCRLRHAVDRALQDNIGMIDVDLPSSSPSSFINVFKPLAAACRRFEERDLSKAG